MRTILQDKKQNYVLDCFRVLAVLMVLTVHIKGVLNEIPDMIDKVFGLGAYGVALYFLISGFFSYSSVEKSSNLKDYAIKKAIRILPIYYVSLLLTFVLDVFIFKDIPLSLRWLYHVFFINMFVPDKEWMWWNSVNFFWTMPSFIAWYILSPLVFHYLNNLRKVAIGALITVVFCYLLKKWMYTFASERFVNWNFFCLLYVFFFGVLAWFVIDKKKHWLGIAYVLGLTVVAWIIGNRSGFLMFALLFYIFVIGTDLAKLKINSIMVCKIIKFLSNISYSVYLSHYFVLKLGASIWTQMHWIVVYIVFIISALAVGILFYKLIEEPITNNLTNRLYKC